MQYYYWQQLNLTYPIDPPSDTGGSDITTHVLQADDGRGSIQVVYVLLSLQ